MTENYFPQCILQYTLRSSFFNLFVYLQAIPSNCPALRFPLRLLDSLVRGGLQECTETQRSSALRGEDSVRNHYTSIVWSVQESKVPARCTACSDVPKLAMLTDGEGRKGQEAAGATQAGFGGATSSQTCKGFTR